MHSLLLPSRFTQQPQIGPLSIDPRWNPSFAVIPSRSPYDAKNRVNGSLVGSAAVVANKVGLALSFNGSTDYAQFPSNTAYNILGELTLVWVGTVTDFANYNMLVTRSLTNGATNNPFELRTDQTSGLVRLTRASAGGFSAWVTSSGVSSNTLLTIIVTQGADSSNSTGSSFWVNGAKVSSSQISSNASGLAGANTEPMYVGRRADGYYHKGTTSLVAGFPRILSDTEIISLSANPWQIFKAPPRYLFSDAGGGGGATAYTLACAVGAYTTSGKAATLGLARKLVCATGAYTTSGKATTLTVARKLALEVGAYTTSGKAATLTYVPGAGPVTYTLTCDVGSYAISGKALTLTVNRKLSCAVGAYTTSGKAATLTVAHSLQCATGNYTVSGKAATLTYVALGPITYTLTCSKGSYVVSGKAATLTYTSTIINESEPEYTIYIRARKFKNKSNNKTFVKTLDKRTFKVNS